MRTAILKRALAALLACTVGSTLSGCGSSAPEATDTVTIGLLLPFTGADSATTSNFERAALFAAARVNEAGGIGGKQLRIVSQDTHSELAASRRSVQRLIDSGAKVVVGPESAAIAPELFPLLLDNQVALLSPLVGAGEDPSFDCKLPWFRLAPSAKGLGESLAKRMSLNGVKSIAIVSANDAYNDALSAAVAEKFELLGGKVVRVSKINPEAQSYADVVRSVVESEATAVVLATSARAGALVVNEFDALSTTQLAWYLSPLLKTELLIANVAPGALDGAQGVAPKLYDRSAGFPDAFAARWQGDQPLEGAYFFYDAIALLAFALEKSAAADSIGGAVNGGLSRLVSSVRSSATPTGVGVGWNEIEAGLSGIRDGQQIYYTGLTGPMLLTACGDRKTATTSSFSIANGQIVTANQ